jgi:hypothetical protein
MIHLVALSGGKDSTAMALRLAEIEPREYRYFCTPTGDELPEVIEHWARCERLLGAPIEKITNNGRTLDDWIEHFGALPSHRMRWCTRLLKIEPAIAFMKRLGEVTLYVGLRADEERDGMRDYGSDVTYRLPLREWGWGVGEVWRYLEGRGVCVPRRTDCARCYDQKLIEWKRLRNDHPDRFDAAAAQEEKHGATFRSPSRDTWPAPLVQLRAAFDSGRKIRGEDQYNEHVGSCRVCKL